MTTDKKIKPRKNTKNTKAQPSLSSLRSFAANSPLGNPDGILPPKNTKNGKNKPVSRLRLAFKAYYQDWNFEARYKRTNVTDGNGYTVAMQYRRPMGKLWMNAISGKFEKISINGRWFVALSEADSALADLEWEDNKSVRRI